MIFKSRVLVVFTTNPQYTLASPITPIIPIIRLYPLITPTFPPIASQLSPITALLLSILPPITPWYSSANSSIPSPLSFGKIITCIIGCDIDPVLEINFFCIVPPGLAEEDSCAFNLQSILNIK